MSGHLAAYSSAPTTDRGARRTRTHAMAKGTQHAMCSRQLAVTPRYPQRDFDPTEDDVCVKCVHLLREAIPTERGQRIAYDHAKRTRMLDHPDPGVRAFLMAMHTGGISNARGDQERATDTMGSYRATVKGLWTWNNEQPWQGIDPGVIHAFLHRPNKHNGNPRSPKTIAQNHTALTTFFSFLIDRDFIEGRSPMRHVGRPRRTEETEGTVSRRQLPVEQEVWDAVMASKLGIDARLMLSLCYFGGLRISEVTRLRPQKVNPLLREMDFWRSKSTKWQEDFTYGDYVDGLKQVLPERAAGADEFLDLMDFMTKYRSDLDTLVASNSVGEPEDWWLDQLEHHILPDAGIPPHLFFTPHRLRHNFGHNMIDAGMEEAELQEAMGHVSGDTTKMYTKGVKRSKKWLDRINRQATTDDAAVVPLRRRGNAAR